MSGVCGACGHVYFPGNHCPVCNFPAEVPMAVIPEDSLHQSEKDETGVHHVKNRYCDHNAKSCFSFDCNGRKYGNGYGCTYFDQLYTGVKTCSRPKKLA